MEILLTGATGFLGNRLAHRLLEDGHFVHMVGRRPCRMQHPALKSWIVDLANPSDWSSLPWKNIERIVHLAAAGVKASQRAWADGVTVNITGTISLLDAMERFSGKKIPIFLARTFYETSINSFPALRENPYIVTKAAATMAAEIWHQRTNLPVAFGTIFQVYGPGDNAGNVLSYAARQIAKNAPATFGSGLGLRDWLYVDDAIAAIESLVVSGTSGKFDIGSGNLVSIRNMIESLADVAGADRSLLVFDPSRDRNDGDLIRKAESFPPDWHPIVSPREGLLRLLQS